MADPDLTGLRVTLTGSAEPSLLDATTRAFTTVGADLTVAPGIDSTVGSPDVVVVFARRPSGHAILATDEAAFAKGLEAQLHAPLRAAIGAGRVLAGRSGGVIVLVGSVDLYHAYPGRSVASVAMGGLLGLTRSMAIELAGSGVRTDLVVAGPLGDEAGGGPPEADGAALDRTLLRAPGHRLARPSEVAAAIRFVAGPDAAFMTGQTLRVDGGWSSLNQAPEGMRFP
jgi:3-oxoacyl-[acyl-carrier protein] reductase